MPTLPTSGRLTLADIKSVFGGTASPTRLSDYYRGGGLVPDIPENSNVPTSGRLLISHFYGATTVTVPTEPLAFISDTFIATAYAAQGMALQIDYTPTSAVATLAPTSNPLPNGISLTTNGIIHGQTSIVGSFRFHVRITLGSNYLEQEFYIDVISGGSGGGW